MHLVLARAATNVAQNLGCSAATLPVEHSDIVPFPTVDTCYPLAPNRCSGWPGSIRGFGSDALAIPADLLGGVISFA